jgi:hypothetical protein
VLSYSRLGRVSSYSSVSQVSVLIQQSGESVIQHCEPSECYHSKVGQVSSYSSVRSEGYTAEWGECHHTAA